MCGRSLIFVKPPKNIDADLAFAAPSILAGVPKQEMRTKSEEIASILSDTSLFPEIESVELTGVFINIKLKNDFLIERTLGDFEEIGDKYGQIDQT